MWRTLAPRPNDVRGGDAALCQTTRTTGQSEESPDNNIANGAWPVMTRLVDLRESRSCDDTITIMSANDTGRLARAPAATGQHCIRQACYSDSYIGYLNRPHAKRGKQS